MLVGLYDPQVLRASQLSVLFGIGAWEDPVTRLQRVLIDAVESLSPPGLAPIDSRGWRIYQILRRRYVQQLAQEKVASTSI